MNIHAAVLQQIAAFVYCNRQAAAGRRQHAKDGNFHAPAGACATECALNSGVQLKLLWSPYVIGQTIIFLPCDFYLLSIFLSIFFLFLA